MDEATTAERSPTIDEYALLMVRSGSPNMDEFPLLEDEEYFPARIRAIQIAQMIKDQPETILRLTDLNEARRAVEKKLNGPA